MEKQNLFMYRGKGNYGQHKVVSVEKHEADQLISEGIATPVSFGKYDEYRQQVKEAHKKYTKTRDKVKNSDHPKYSIEGACDYEIKEAYKEFESEAKRFQAEWAQERANMQADADRRAARASVFVSDKDKQTAEQIGNRILASINSVRNKEDLRASVHRAANDINYLTDPEKTALQMKMGDIVDSVRAQANRYGSTSVTPVTILDSLRDIRNEDILSRDVANQLPQNVDIEYMQSRAVSKAPKSKIGQVE